MIHKVSKGSTVEVRILGGQAVEVGRILSYNTAKIEITSIYFDSKSKIIRGIALSDFSYTTNLSLWNWEVENKRQHNQKEFNPYAPLIRDVTNTEDYRPNVESPKNELILQPPQKPISKPEPTIIKVGELVDLTGFPEVSEYELSVGDEWGFNGVSHVKVTEIGYKYDKIVIRGEVLKEFEEGTHKWELIQTPVYDIKWVQAGDFQLLERYELI